MGLISAITGEITRNYTGWLIVLSILTLFEICNARKPVPLKGRIGAIAFWLISIPLASMLGMFFGAVCNWFDLKPLVTLPMIKLTSWMGFIAPVCAVLLAAAVADFFFYWYHRAEHRWLWRWHAVHHSIRDLNAINSYHHLSETAFYLVVIAATQRLIISDTGPGLPFMSLMLWLHAVYIHSPTKFSFGPFRSIFADNRFHRIHHSLEPQHHDHNFGAFTTLWDRLFGTAYFPKPNEWPEVGIEGVAQPMNVVEWLSLPQRYPRNKIGLATGSVHAEPSNY